jgi:hypothetical protein
LARRSGKLGNIAQEGKIDLVKWTIHNSFYWSSSDSEIATEPQKRATGKEGKKIPIHFTRTKNVTFLYQNASLGLRLYSMKFSKYYTSYLSHCIKWSLAVAEHK